MVKNNKNIKELENVPEIGGCDFGHTSPTIIFPIGGEAKIIADKNRAKVLITKQ